MRKLSLLIAGLTMAGISTSYAEGVLDSIVGSAEKMASTPIPVAEKGPPLPNSTENTLSLERCLSIAMAENLDLAGKVVALEGKEAAETATFRKMLPTLALSSSRSDILTSTSGGSEAESYTTSVTLTQPIYRGKSLWGGWKKAELATRQAEFDLIRQGQQLVSDVKSAWYSVLEKEQLLHSSKEAFKRLKIHESNAKAYFEVGRYWQNEVLQAQVEVAKGEQAVIEAENSLLLAKSTLNRLMRRPLSAPINVDASLEWQEMTKLSLDEAYNQARANRKDLEKSYLDMETSKWSEVTTGSSLVPKVDFTTVYSTTGLDASYHEYDATTTAKVSLTWTAWNWGQTSKEVTAAKATTRQNQLSYDDKIQGVLLEVREAYLNAQQASKKVKVLEKSLKQAEENLKVNEIRYQQQLGSATDVLDALDLRTTTRDSYISSLSSYLTALATLDLAVGYDVVGLVK
ncbi:MAG: TolC family protein [Magnetococcales bacterium]|nr:TolC family protein [Magnetococcales bacterium]